MTRKPKVDREAFPLVYIGAPTKWLKPGAALHALRDEHGRHLRGNMGMRCYTTSDGEGVQVPPTSVVPYEPPRRAPLLERVREAFRR